MTGSHYYTPLCLFSILACILIHNNSLIDSETSRPIRREILSRLTSKQREAIELINKGKNVFITGGAGTGKSFILQYFNEKKHFIKLAPTGTSFTHSIPYSPHIHSQLLIGISAAGIEGMTYHSYFTKLNFTPRKDAKKSYTNVASDVEKCIENIKCER